MSTMFGRMHVSKQCFPLRTTARRKQYSTDGRTCENLQRSHTGYKPSSTPNDAKLLVSWHGISRTRWPVEKPHNITSNKSNSLSLTFWSRRGSPNICWPSVCNLPHVTLLVPRILRKFADFLIICGSPHTMSEVALLNIWESFQNYKNYSWNVLIRPCP